MAQGAERPRRRQHHHHVGRKQERLETSTRGTDGRGEGLCRSVKIFPFAPRLPIFIPRSRE